MAQLIKPGYLMNSFQQSSGASFFQVGVTIPTTDASGNFSNVSLPAGSQVGDLVVMHSLSGTPGGTVGGAWAHPGTSGTLNYLLITSLGNIALFSGETNFPVTITVLRGPTTVGHFANTGSFVMTTDGSGNGSFGSITKSAGSKALFLCAAAGGSHLQVANAQVLTNPTPNTFINSGNISNGTSSVQCVFLADASAYASGSTATITGLDASSNYNASSFVEFL